MSDDLLEAITYAIDVVNEAATAAKTAKRDVALVREIQECGARLVDIKVRIVEQRRRAVVA